MALHIIFGQYFKICSSKVTSTFLRFYCICASAFAMYYSIVYLAQLIKYDLKGYSYNSSITIEFFLWCLTSQITSQTYISKYINSIINCDFFMGYTKKVLEIKYVFMLMLLCIALSMISLLGDSFISKYWVGMFSKDRYNVLFLVSQWFMMQSAELANFRVFVVLGLLQNRLMMVRQTLENNAIPMDIVRKNEIRLQLRTVRNCLINYKNLLDAFDTVNGHMQFVVSTFYCLFKIRYLFGF